MIHFLITVALIFAMSVSWTATTRHMVRMTWDEYDWVLGTAMVGLSTIITMILVVQFS